jgi:hypothetical protein
MAEMITNLLQAQTRSDEMTGTSVPKTMRTATWYLNAQGLDAAADNVVHGARRERLEWGSERRRGRGSSIQGKTIRDSVGKFPWAAGTAYNLQRRAAAQPGRGRVGHWRAGLGGSLCSPLTRSFVCDGNRNWVPECSPSFSQFQRQNAPFAS